MDLIRIDQMIRIDPETECKKQQQQEQQPFYLLVADGDFQALVLG